jgi:pyruvate kinase
VRNEEAVCRIVTGGSLSSEKGVNLPDKGLKPGALTRRDVDLLEFALANGADFVGISFVTTSKDLLRAKRIVREAHSEAWIIAKIETRMAVENIENIVEQANGIMVARGDLGVGM